MQSGEDGRYELDPHSILNRATTAVPTRRVTLRPTPETMSVLTGVLLRVQGVAVLAALKAEAATRRACRICGPLDQTMADTLVVNGSPARRPPTRCR